MPLNLRLLLQTDASWRSVAERILERPWSEEEAEEWPRTQRWKDSRVWIGDALPTSWDPVLTDLGIDYRIKATFILNREDPMYDQVSCALSAAARVHASCGGRGALLFEMDEVILRWSDERLVVNELSSFKDHALEVLGHGVAVEPIPWE